MNGARFVHDSLEFVGWEVLIADAQRVRGLAPLAAKTDRIDARTPRPATPDTVMDLVASVVQTLQGTGKLTP